jgi:hypothetical protein
MVNKYGVLVGGGSLAVLLISAILATYITRGLILVLVPLFVVWFVGMEIIQYVLDKKYSRKE